VRGAEVFSASAYRFLDTIIAVDKIVMPSGGGVSEADVFTESSNGVR
jgi:hypothetical protein